LADPANGNRFDQAAFATGGGFSQTEFTNDLAQSAFANGAAFGQSSPSLGGDIGPAGPPGPLDQFTASSESLAAAPFISDNLRLGKSLGRTTPASKSTPSQPPTVRQNPRLGKSLDGGSGIDIDGFAADLRGGSYIIHKQGHPAPVVTLPAHLPAPLPTSLPTPLPVHQPEEAAFVHTVGHVGPLGHQESRVAVVDSPLGRQIQQETRFGRPGSPDGLPLASHLLQGAQVAAPPLGGHSHSLHDGLPHLHSGRVTAVDTPVGSAVVEDRQVAGPDGQVAGFVNVQGQHAVLHPLAQQTRAGVFPVYAVSRNERFVH